MRVKQTAKDIILAFHKLSLCFIFSTTFPINPLNTLSWLSLTLRYFPRSSVHLKPRAMLNWSRIGQLTLIEKDTLIFSKLTFWPKLSWNKSRHDFTLLQLYYSKSVLKDILRRFWTVIKRNIIILHHIYNDGFLTVLECIVY